MIPGLSSKLKTQTSMWTKQIERTKAIILSMTKKERLRNYNGSAVRE